MAFSDIPGDVIAARFIPLIDHDPAIHRTTNQQTEILQEQNADNLLVLIVELLRRVDILEAFASLTAELPDKAPSIAHKKPLAFEPKLT